MADIIFRQELVQDNLIDAEVFIRDINAAYARAVERRGLKPFMTVAVDEKSKPVLLLMA